MAQQSENKTIVLLSGGLDSSTLLALFVNASECHLALGFDYGQPHHIELKRAALIAKHFNIPFEIVRLPHLPKVNDVVFAGRNMVFISHAIAFAQARGFHRVAAGPNAGDWQQFPDCRPDFWRQIAICAEAYGVQVVTPFIHARKSDIVKQARLLKVPIELTWSCYDPQGEEPCGKCLACKVRKEALA